MLNTSFPSGSLEGWHMLSRGCLCVQTSIKTQGTESLMNFLVGNNSHALSHLTEEDMKCALCDSTWNGALGSLCLVSLGLHPFPFPDYALNPFAITNRECWYDYVLSPMSHPSI